MKKCRTCGKHLGKRRKPFCKTCENFHKNRYSKEELQKILEEYERLEQ